MAATVTVFESYRKPLELSEPETTKSTSYPRNLNALFQVIEYIIRSMPKGCQQVIDRNGYWATGPIIKIGPSLLFRTVLPLRHHDNH